MTKLTAEKCRAQFEEWFADHAGQTIEWVRSQRETETHYKIGPEIQSYWMTWQASREALDTDLPAQDGQSGWIEWGGGEMPVAECTVVQVKFRDGYETKTYVYASAYRWYFSDGNSDSDIIAYRVIENDGRGG